jgi:DNA polymerase-3 subunit gamma/tau
MNIANQCDLSYKLSKNQRLQVELALLKMCNLQSVFNLAANPIASMSAPGEQLKKKPDPAGITPQKENKPGNDLAIANDAPAVYQTVKPQVDNKQPVKEEAAEKPKVFIPNLHAASTSVKIPSLKDVGKTKEAALEEEDPYIRGTAKDDYTPDQFFKCWSDFAAMLKSDGKKNALTIFITNPPKLIQPDHYEVIVENKVQETTFREERPNLLNFLRTSLRNFNIEVSVRIDEKAVIKRPYTASEKFQHMAAKNPALVDLKNKFNLDFD